MITHTIGSYTLCNLKKLLEGQSWDVYRGKLKRKTVILKLLKLEYPELTNRIIKNNIHIRNRLSNFIKVPDVIDIGFKNELYLIEEYRGISLANFLSKDTWSKDDFEVIEKCIGLIKNFPEDIPLDTNPYNFTIDAKGVISFVDFMPPDPWEFLDTPKLRKYYEECFPQVINAYKRRYIREKRYFLNKYRIIKLLHYFDIS